jgi:hypothetical protein
MPSDRMLNGSVSVTRKTWSNVRGQRTVASTTIVTLPASVQVDRRTSRREVYGLTAGQTLYVAYFRAEPNVDAQDEIAWNGKVLSVLGPARDEAGRGRVWAVDTQELG